MAFALGADPEPGMLLPGAGPLDPGTLELGAVVGGGFITPEPDQHLGVLGVSGRWAVAERWVLSGLGGMMLTSELSAPTVMGASVRGNFVQRPTLRAGFAWSTVVIFPTPDLELALGVSPVLVLEGGGATRWDLSLPLMPLDLASEPSVGTSAVAAVALLEGGVTLPIGARSSLRLGKDVAGLSAALRMEGRREGATTVRFATWGLTVGLAVEWSVRIPRPPG